MAETAAFIETIPTIFSINVPGSPLFSIVIVPLFTASALFDAFPSAAIAPKFSPEFMFIIPEPELIIRGFPAASVATTPLSTLIAEFFSPITFIIPSFVILSAAATFRKTPVFPFPPETFIIPVVEFLATPVYPLTELPPVNVGSSITPIPEDRDPLKSLVEPLIFIVPLFANVDVELILEDNFKP